MPWPAPGTVSTVASDPRVVVMGVAGSGKTTVGRVLAQRLAVPFLDADDYHSREAVAAMRAGRPLDDDARASWLQRVNAAVRALAPDGFVLACSALKHSYRDVLRSATDGLLFVHLDVPTPELQERLRARHGHYAGVDLLPSQLATLELGDDVVPVAADASPEVVVARILDVVERTPS